jgi:transcriptional regulator with XRE-family HTH domain
MSEQRIALGQQLAHRRQQLGWTVRGLASRIGRQPSRVSETETGRANSSIDSLAEMASVMRMRIMLIPEEAAEQVMMIINPRTKGAMIGAQTTPSSVFDEIFIRDPEDADDHS